MPPIDIDALLRETEATLLSLTPTTTEETQETLEDDLESVVVFQQECERRLDDLTEKKVAVREGRGGEEEDDMTQGEEGRAGVEERRGGRRGEEEEKRKGRGSNGRRGGAEEDGRERTGRRRDEVRGAEEDSEGRKEGGAQGEKNQGEGEKKGRADIKEEEEEEEMKLARKSLLEVANDLTGLQPQPSEARPVRPKSKLGPRGSTGSQNSNTTGPFGSGQPVTEKPRPLLSHQNSLSFTMDNLQQELTYLLDMFLKDPEKSGDDADFAETTTTTITTKATTPTSTEITITATTPTTTDITTKATTPTTADITTTATTPTATNTTTIANTTNTASPPTLPLQQPERRPNTIRSYSSTTTINTTITDPTTTPPPLSATSTDSRAFIYPPVPHSEDNHHHDHHQRPFFSSLVGGVKNLGWRNSLRRKKKRRTLVIGEPQDFRQLKATTSIRPNEDPFMLAAIDFSETRNGTPGGNGTAGQGTGNGMVREGTQ